MPSDVNITQHWNTTVIEKSVFSFAALKFRLTLSGANRTLATDHYWYRSKNLRNTYNAKAPLKKRQVNGRPMYGVRETRPPDPTRTTH